MSVTAETPGPGHESKDCTGCGGSKGAPIATVVYVGSERFAPSDPASRGKLVLCEECGRDIANAIGFMCIREGGWSKLEPRKRGHKIKAQQSTGSLSRKKTS